MSQALYRKWRPARFEDVVGQEHVTRTLQNSVAAGRVGHAYLFCGPRGTGKTTLARLLAKAVNCLHEDVAERPCNNCSVCEAINKGRSFDAAIEIDAASHTGVDDIRSLREKAPSGASCRFKVYIIDEVHMLSTAAFNALLKTLEEPPPHVKFVLATTEEHKVPVTIKSRCQQFNFRLLTVEEIGGRLTWLAQKEGFTIEPDALNLIANQGHGSIRDAESLLDQLVSGPNDVITAERAQLVLGTASNAAVIALTDAWLNGDGGQGLNRIHEALAAGADARQFSRQMVTYLRQLLLLQAAGQELPFDGTPEQKQQMLAQAKRAPRRRLIAAIKTFTEAAMTPAGSWQPQLPLELAFIEMLPQTPALPSAPVQQVPPATAQPTPKPAPPPESETAAAPEPEDAEPEPAQEVATAETAAAPEKPDTTEAASPPPSAETTAEKRVLSLQMIQPRWRDVVNQAGEQNRNLPALLNMGKPLAVEGNTLIIGFDFPIFKEKFDNTQGAPELLSDIVTDLTGVQSRVRSVIASDYSVSIHDEDIQALAQELGGVVQDEE